MTSQNKEENNGNLNVSIFFFGCGVDIELCEAHGAMTKWLPLENRGVKREVIFHMESGLFLF